MQISFPAMEGVIGGRKYYSCLMKLSTVPKMLTFRDWAEFTPEQREQRVLNKRRVPEIARYMLDNEDGYLFSSITASYKCEVDFVPNAPGGALGELQMEFENANFVINDGQHRCAGITAAIAENKSLGEETISVLLFPYESLDRVQQMFSDLNSNVSKTSKSLDILYDKRDPHSRIALEVVEKVPVFNGMVDKDAISLPVRSAKLFTLSAIFDATQELTGNLDTEAGMTYNEALSRALDYWGEVAKMIPRWGEVKSGEMKSVVLRQEYICAHSVVLRALGSVGADLFRNHPNEWKEKLEELKKVDWRKVNKDWENVCIVANSVVSNRQARLATKAYLKRKLDLVLTEPEKRSLPTIPAMPRDSLEVEAGTSMGECGHSLPTIPDVATTAELKIIAPTKSNMPASHANGASFSAGRPGKLAHQLALLSDGKGITKNALIDSLCATFGDGSAEDRRRHTATVSGQLGGQWRSEKGIILRKEDSGEGRLYSVDFEVTAAYLALTDNSHHASQCQTRFESCPAFLKRLNEARPTDKHKAEALAKAKDVQNRALPLGATAEASE